MATVIFDILSFAMLRLHTVSVLVLATVLSAAACAEHDGSGASGSGKRIVDYHDARPLLWGTVYAGGGETLYCGRKFGTRKSADINIEHVFPMSWVAWHLQCGKRRECRRASARFNLVEADLHNLWPSLITINKARRSHPFAMIEGEKHLLRGCDFEVDERHRVVEPRVQARGKIARSMFYMANEYGLKIRSRLARTLKRWNREHRVGVHEQQRNDVIEKIQGNRNLYIDNSRIADKQDF